MISLIYRLIRVPVLFCRRRAPLGLVPVQGDRERHPLGGRREGTNARCPVPSNAPAVDRIAASLIPNFRLAEFVFGLKDPNC
jgi:hypothetical protein